jgi:hypothetical protein
MERMSRRRGPPNGSGLEGSVVALRGWVSIDTSRMS